ncbi:hypothetical protein BOTBODRAFT_83558, partial [Botryobasidium botryosum FD-172 SS1]
TCQCCPASTALLMRGYFPCAPSRPTIAFHLDLLELIALQMKRGAPNATAWAETLEAFWCERQYLIAFQDTLRCRLGNATQWYQVL